LKRIRRLGLSALGALALTASIGVASASASGFVATGDPFFATVNGTATGTHTIGFAGNTASCTGANFQGEIDEPSESINPSLSTPSCGGQSLALNGCTFSFHPGAEKSPGVFGGTADTGPSGCGPIGPYKFAACSVSFYPSTGLAATFENKGSGAEATVAITINATNFQYKVSPAGCGTNKIENGTYKGSWTVKATRNGSQVGLQVQSKLPVALGIGTEKAQLEATHYPVSIAGAAEGGSPTWKLLGGSMSCKSAQYGATASGPTASLPVSVSYSDCSAFGSLPMSVSSNGCTYVFNFSGTEDVSCPEGKSMEFLVYVSEAARKEGKAPICVVKFAAQTGLASLGFGSVNYQAISVASNLSKIKYTQVRNSFLCPAGVGPFENGTYVDSTTLYGSR
jgi:hypothetical protein